MTLILISPPGLQVGPKNGGRHRARVATSLQVQNRMVEILRMCGFDISNPDTASRRNTQVIATQAFSRGGCHARSTLPSIFLEAFTKNWKSDWSSAVRRLREPAAIVVLPIVCHRTCVDGIMSLLPSVEWYNQFALKA